MAAPLLALARGPQLLVSILRATQPPRRVFNVVQDMLSFITVLETLRTGCH
jgi:hypothetical protein